MVAAKYWEQQQRGISHARLRLRFGHAYQWPLARIPRASPGRRINICIGTQVHGGAARRRGVDDSERGHRRRRGQLVRPLHGGSTSAAGIQVHLVAGRLSVEAQMVARRAWAAATETEVATRPRTWANRTIGGLVQVVKVWSVRSIVRDRMCMGLSAGKTLHPSPLIWLMTTSWFGLLDWVRYIRSDDRC
jgi:hypothetical protein